MPRELTVWLACVGAYDGVTMTEGRKITREMIMDACTEGGLLAFNSPLALPSITAKRVDIMHALSDHQDDLFIITVPTIVNDTPYR